MEQELPPAGRGELRTRCGRRIVVSRLVIGGDDPIGRVTVRINCQSGERGQLWAGLTADEARLLARHLTVQAGLLEDADPAGGSPAGQKRRRGGSR